VEDAWLPSFVLLLFLYAGAPVPALPGRIGLHQALCLAALAPFGLSTSVALAAAAIVYAQSVILPSVIGGLVGIVFLRTGLEATDGAGMATRTA